MHRPSFKLYYLMTHYTIMPYENGMKKDLSKYDDYFIPKKL